MKRVKIFGTVSKSANLKIIFVVRFYGYCKFLQMLFKLIFGKFLRFFSCVEKEILIHFLSENVITDNHDIRVYSIIFYPLTKNSVSFEYSSFQKMRFLTNEKCVDASHFPYVFLFTFKSHVGHTKKSDHILFVILLKSFILLFFFSSMFLYQWSSKKSNLLLVIVVKCNLYLLLTTK